MSRSNTDGSVAAEVCSVCSVRISGPRLAELWASPGRVESVLERTQARFRPNADGDHGDDDASGEERPVDPDVPRDVMFEALNALILLSIL